jgi:hypothetical protein
VKIADSYRRHLASGDQAGAALGMLFLAFWDLPIATVLLLIGLRKARSEDLGRTPSRSARAASALVFVNAGILLVFGAAYVVVQTIELRQGIPDMGPAWRPDLAATLWFGGIAAVLLGLAGVWMAIASLSFRPLEVAARRVLPIAPWWTAGCAILIDASFLSQIFRGGSPTTIVATLIQILPLGAFNVTMVVLLIRRARSTGLSEVAAA